MLSRIQRLHPAQLSSIFVRIVFKHRRKAQTSCSRRYIPALYFILAGNGLEIGCNAVGKNFWMTVMEPGIPTANNGVVMPVTVSCSFSFYNG